MIKLIFITVALAAFALCVILGLLAVFSFLMTGILTTATKFCDAVCSVLGIHKQGYEQQYESSGYEYSYDADDFEKMEEDQGPVEEKLASDPYTILGIRKGASKEEIKSAYKSQMVMYHPDKAAHLGPKLRDLALQQTKLIRQAYDSLMK